MLLAHKIEIRPTQEQKQYLRKCCGISRLIYNECLAYSKDLKWNKKEIMSYYQTKLRDRYPFITEVSTRVSRSAIDDLENSYKRFFNKTSKFPKFKKKKLNESFSIREKEKFTVKDRSLKIEKLKTKLKLRNKLRFNGIPKQVTISFSGGKWFASILVETSNIKSRNPRDEVVGVDLGLKTLATLSDGNIFNNPKSFRSKERKLAKLQKKLSRQVKDSNNYNETKLKVNKLHFYIAKQREACLQELYTFIISNYKVIVIENLNVVGMLKNRKLSKSIMDAGFGMFSIMMDYKSKIYGNKLIYADTFYPSSKTCSNCGSIKKDLKLSDRVYKCEHCGFEIDRDLNASINLKKLAIGYSDSINDNGV